MLPPLYALLTGVIVIGAIPLVLRPREYPLPGLALACVLALLAQGWLVTWVPVFHPVEFASEGLADTTFENLHQLSFDSMMATSLLLGAFVVACGLFCHARLRRLLLYAAAGSGVLISVVGIFLKIVGDPVMRYVWAPGELDWNDFAFYR